MHEDDMEKRVRIIHSIVHAYQNHPLVYRAITLSNNQREITVGTADPFKRYLEEISQYNLLEPADEVRLFKIIDRGINVYKVDGLAVDDEQAFIDMAIARQILYLSNLRLVIGHARKRAFRMSLMDCIQEGNVGVAMAIDRFDYSKGFKFSTYATWWIKQQITRSIFDKSRTIRIPVHIHDKLIKVARTVRKLTADLNREPELWEIATELDEPVSEVSNLLGYEKLEAFSLNEPIENGDIEKGELIVHPSLEIEDASDRIDDDIYTQRIFNNSGLDLREKFVLSLRLGLEVNSLKGQMFVATNGNVLLYDDLLESMLTSDGITLDSLGSFFGATRERIRQLENSALKKLRLSYQH